MPRVHPGRHEFGPVMPPLAERFWPKVDKRESCWLWIGSKDISGYGRMSRAGRGEKAHRLAWELTHGAIPAGLSVLHRCDVRACVRPEHLFLGTPRDNSHDAMRKGRLASGLRNGGTKLTDDHVLAVRCLLASGWRQRDIAQRFGVSQHLISLINRGYRSKAAA
jgi:hypothetical protein